MPASLPSPRAVLIDLLALQSLTRRGGVPRIEELDAIDQVRSRLPPEIVRAFESRTAHGQFAIAIVQDGGCGACHVRLGPGKYADLLNPHVLATCDACGCFLFLPPGERPEAFPHKGGRKAGNDTAHPGVFRPRDQQTLPVPRPFEA